MTAHRKNMSQPAQARRARALERLQNQLHRDPAAAERESKRIELAALQVRLKNRTPV